MIEKNIRIILRFVLLVMVQVLVLNRIRLGGYLNPYVYVLFLLLLPFEMPGWALLATAFFLGLSIDMFTDTPGMHAAACLFLAFCRPFVLRLTAPREGYENNTLPTLFNQGLRWFITYAGILVFLHHLLLFYVEVFRLSEFFSTLLRVILSTLLTLSIIVLTQYLFYKPSGRK